MVYARRLADPAELLAELERDHAAAARNATWVRCGVTGSSGFTIAELKRRITRKRPRGSGSLDDLAHRMRDRLDELAASRWRRATKGQRATRRAVDRLTAEVTAAITTAQARAQMRTVSEADVYAVALAAIATGIASDDGGRVTAASYKYRWFTTTVTGVRQPNGSVRVTISRSVTRVIDAPAKVWTAASAGHVVSSRQ